MKKLLCILLVCLMAVPMMMIAHAEAAEPLFIGVSFDSATDAGGIAQKDSFQKAADARGWKLVMADAGGAMEKQLADCEDLINQGVDWLIVKPKDSEGIVPIVELCQEKGINLVMHERYAAGKTAGEDYAFQTINDQIVQGNMCGQFVVDKFGTENPVKIIEIRGTEGAQDVTNRATGFREKLTDNCEIIAEQTANWKRSEGQSVMENLLQSTGGDFDVVYCHNDEMAMGVVLAFRQQGVTGKSIVTIDGQEEAIQCVFDGEIDFLMSSNRRWGDVVFDNIQLFVDGGEYQTTILGEEVPTTIDNANEVMNIMWEKDCEGYQG